MTTVFKSAEDMLASTGLALGTSEWVLVDQARIDLFAEATGDHQWIHVDPVRAAEGPFGCTVAHGYLTLSLANLFLPQLMQVQNMQMGVNYGCDRVRFPAPVTVGSRVRGRGEVVKVEQVGAAVQQTVRVTVEIEGADRPGCVVDTVSRYTFNSLNE
ncbi:MULTISPECIES: MaoC family dehydratase [Pseudomonas]|uniref:MaoC family dehydratase n=1 Tax=Serpens gallinarum TaxID=2763075 RepID=A0ABR8TSJ2_9PSED|nr:MULTISPECIES: MaoC family dehydratase [Pseudomonas]MBD7978745.1 MaoC family dehydratase [Serpens gallinarum]MBF0676579.1 MaoC family dehydratase [Pseudomonas sp.]